MSIKCPSHKSRMFQLVNNGVELDGCSAGCAFFDRGELQTYVNYSLAQRGLRPIQLYLPGTNGHHGGFDDMLSGLGGLFGFGQKACPRHRVKFSEVRSGNVNIDVCLEGCTFFDPNELNTFIEYQMHQGGYGQHYQPVTPVIPHGQRVHNPRQFFMGSHQPVHGSRHHSDSPDGFPEAIFGSNSPEWGGHSD